MSCDLLAQVAVTITEAKVATCIVKTELLKLNLTSLLLSKRPLASNQTFQEFAYLGAQPSVGYTLNNEKLNLTLRLLKQYM